MIRRKLLTRRWLPLNGSKLEDPSFHPYNSKYDDYLDGKGQLSEQERRGLSLFDDRRRGNCASCHLDRQGGGRFASALYGLSVRSFQGYRAIWRFCPNAAPGYFDMGLCGPMRRDQAGQSKFCGLFKTPTLRNVATRSVFFHNGRFHTLKEALRFYVQRDTDPRLWYPVSASGEVNKFNDLPTALRGNVDVIDQPLTRKEGGTQAWTDHQRLTT